MTLNQVGDVVRDINRCQTGEVTAVNGDVLSVVRPSGLSWNTLDHHCRPASAAERAQLQTNRELRLKSLHDSASATASTGTPPPS